MKRTTLPAEIDVTSLPSRLDPVPSARVGAVIGRAADGRPLVSFEGSASTGVAAESMVPFTAEELAAAAARRQAVVLLFDGGDPTRPIVAGPVAPPPLPAVLEAHLTQVPEFAEVDGKRVRIEGKDEIVLSCGEASITLRRNGRIVVRGTYVESYSRGTNRIKGAAVKIN